MTSTNVWATFDQLRRCDPSSLSWDEWLVLVFGFYELENTADLDTGLTRLVARLR